jgi:hypothetical protein
MPRREPHRGNRQLLAEIYDLRATMTLVPLDISKELFRNQPKEQLKKGSFALDLKNVLVTEAGAHVDMPGFSQFSQVSAAPFSQIGINGIYPFKNRAVITGETGQIYALSSVGALLKLSTLVEGTDGPLEGVSRPSFCDDGDFVYIADGGGAKRWDGSSSTVEYLGGSPPDFLDIVFLDHYIIGLQPNSQTMVFAGPTADDRADVDASNAFEAEGLPDNGLKLAVTNRQLFCFGKESTEIFFNFGDSVVPFQRPSDGFLESGVGRARCSVVAADNTLFWMDQEQRFVKLEGRTPRMISGEIAKELKRLSVVADCWGAFVEIDGHFYVQWVFPHEGVAYRYNILTGGWGTREAFGTEWEAPKMNSYAYIPPWQKHLVGHKDYGIVYEMNFDSKSELAHAGDFSTTPPTFESRTMRRVIRRRFTHDTDNLKKSAFYQLNLQRGNGSSDESETEPFIEMRVKDDEKPWTSWVQVGLGRKGDNEKIVKVTDLAGIYSARELEIACQADVPFSLNSLHENFEVLGR